MNIDKNIQKKILQLIGWSEEKYAQFIYDCGIEYLKCTMPEYPLVVKEISASENFWNWWKAHWELRDQEFIEKCFQWDEGIDSRIEIYKIDHDPRTLASAIYLNGLVLQQSYANMIGDITKQQKKHAYAS